MKQVFNPIFTLLLICFAVFPALAQNAPVTINWNYSARIPGASPKTGTIPSFEGAYLDYGVNLPYYQLLIPEAEVGSFELKNPVYVALTSQESKNLPKDKLKSSPEISFYSGKSNGKINSVVRFVPIRVNAQNGQPEKLISFEYGYTTKSNLKQGRKNARTYVTKSVLSSGEWFKIGVTGTGIFKLDRATLQSMGLNMQTLDPKRIQIYGNGGAMLPQANDAPRQDDLVQNHIFVQGENDGVFNNDDYVLFYAQGPHTWQADKQNQRFIHNYNIYTDTAFYYLTVGNSYGKRVVQTSVSGTPSKTLTTYNEHLLHESDLKNLLKSGREWYGEEFNSYNLSKDFAFPITYLVNGSDVSITSSVLGVSPVVGIGGRFTLKLNGAPLGVQVTEGHGGYNYHVAGRTSLETFKLNTNNIPFDPTQLKVNIQFDQIGQPSANGYLNYLELNARRQLNLYDNQTSFRTFENAAPNAISQFQIGNVTNNGDTYVWNVTNPLQPVQQAVSIAGNQATFIARTDSVCEFIIFSGSNFQAPDYFGRVTNQNLHSLNQDGKLDLVIVTHPQFWDQSNQLANHRRQNDKLKVAVVSTNQIFNEFSSGAGDPTGIRDFMKMIYDRKNQMGTKTADSLIYLLLMGDASYDYKSKSPVATQNRTPNNTNFVPVYESRESLHPVTTYSSEDYYALLDDNEGDWNEVSSREFLDIGIGRIPVHSYDEASVVINKIINYMNPDNFGKWRNRISFVADDEDANMFIGHAQEVTSILEKKIPGL